MIIIAKPNPMILKILLIYFKFRYFYSIKYVYLLEFEFVECIRTEIFQAYHNS